MVWTLWFCPRVLYKNCRPVCTDQQRHLKLLAHKASHLFCSSASIHFLPIFFFLMLCSCLAAVSTSVHDFPPTLYRPAEELHVVGLQGPHPFSSTSICDLSMFWLLVAAKQCWWFGPHELLPCVAEPATSLQTNTVVPGAAGPAPSGGRQGDRSGGLLPAEPSMQDLEGAFLSNTAAAAAADKW